MLSTNPLSTSRSERRSRLASPARSRGPRALPFGDVGPIQAKAGCACGGMCPRCAGGAAQAKLTVGSVNDPLEHEADRVAERVMSMRDDAARSSEAAAAQGLDDEPATAGGGRLQREMEAGAALDEDPLAGEPEGLDYATDAESEAEPAVEMDEEPVQAKRAEPVDRAGSGTATAGGSYTQRLRDALSGGRALEPEPRRFMESRFGTSFGSVRIHDDSRADTLARDIGARAFTFGSNVFFRRGEYAPGHDAGRRLLAHELTHVVQQSGAIRRKPAGGLAGSISRASGGGPVLRREVEVHVNLHHGGGALQSVKVYDSTGTDRVFTTSAGTGDRTSSLIRREHYSIRNKVGPPPAKSYRWGLQYFCPFSGGIGFHSNIAYPLRSTLCSDGERSYCRGRQDERVRKTLIVDGTPRSHGCLRLVHGDARTVFNAVSRGTRVYVYDRASWRSPSWSSAADRALPP